MAEWHIHPNPPMIYGRRLVVGDRVKAGDVFAAANGKWEVVTRDSTFVGMAVAGKCQTYWVRPERQLPADSL